MDKKMSPDVKRLLDEIKDEQWNEKINKLSRAILFSTGAKRKELKAVMASLKKERRENLKK